MDLKEIIVNGNVVGYEPRIDGRKKVYTPAQKPDGRFAGENYDLMAWRGTTYIPPRGLSGGALEGPYLALWRSSIIFDRALLRGQPAPEQEYVVSAHDEDEGTMDILMRSYERKDAYRFFESDEMRTAYPARLSQSHGGSRDGAGKPSTLIDPTVLTFTVNGEVARKIKALAKEQGKPYAEILREMAEKL